MSSIFDCVGIEGFRYPEPLRTPPHRISNYADYVKTLVALNIRQVSDQTYVKTQFSIALNIEVYTPLPSPIRRIKIITIIILSVCCRM